MNMSVQKQTWTFISYELNLNSSQVKLDNNEHHYAYNVLRIEVDNEVEVTNCNGLKALGIVETVNKKEVLIKIKKIIPEKLPEIQVNLILATPKPSTLEEVIASASEIGASEIHIFKGERSAFKSAIKLDKLKLLSDQAARISKSCYSSKIFIYDNINNMYEKFKLEKTDNNLFLFCDESHVYNGKINNSIYSEVKNNFHKNIKNIFIVVGPEASFSAYEREIIKEKMNAVTVSLGNNILRVPNAVLSALGVALNFRNDLNISI